MSERFLNALFFLSKESVKSHHNIRNKKKYREGREKFKYLNNNNNDEDDDGDNNNGDDEK